MSFYLLCLCVIFPPDCLKELWFFFFFGCFLSCAHPNESGQMEAELLFNLWHSLTCTQILFSLWCWIIDPFSRDFHCLSAEHAVQPWSGPHLLSETHFRYSKSSVPTHTLALTVALSVHKNNSALFVRCAPSSHEKPNLRMPSWARKLLWLCLKSK